MYKIGDIPEPRSFRYKDIFTRGRPCHAKTDSFRIRHPSMDVGKRAKIFAPFDALRGFNEAVSAKDELYEDRKELNEDDLAELNRRLSILRRLTFNRRAAAENHAEITVTYFAPCPDPAHEAYGIRGRYLSLSGICRHVDPDERQYILVGDTQIFFQDIYMIESESGIFDIPGNT